jgi:hypothetical protein
MSDIQEEIKIAHRKALEQDFNEIIKELKQEEHKNLELSMRINKAIEYIEKYNLLKTKKPKVIFEIENEKLNKILNVLKGKE